MTKELRPLKILLYCDPKDERTLNLEHVTKIVSTHYRIPIIFLEDILSALQSLDTELSLDLKEEFEQIKEYLDSQHDNSQLTEPTKVLFRAIKWRLSQNDCKNRGYIFVNYPLGYEDAKHIFLKCKLKRKKKKVKAQPIVKENNEEGEFNENEEGEAENLENKEENPEQTGENEEEKEEEAENLEENPEENAEDLEEGEAKKKNQEEFFPESVVFLKRLNASKEAKSSEILRINRFFDENQIEAFLYDTFQKSSLELFESLKLYIEREGTPFNYLESEESLKCKHFEYYEKVNSMLSQNKEDRKLENERRVNETKSSREKNAEEQFLYVKNNEINEKSLDYPFREYLTKFVVPHLTPGLLEVTQIRPEDPVEFLAEYLFKKSFEL